MTAEKQQYDRVADTITEMKDPIENQELEDLEEILRYIRKYQPTQYGIRDFIDRKMGEIRSRICKPEGTERDYIDYEQIIIKCSKCGGTNYIDEFRP